jgi:hypothetical protein
MINWARVVRDPTVTSSIGQFAAVQSASRTFGVEVIPLGGRDAEDIERTIVEFAAGSNRGLISVAIPLTITHRSLIISLAARHRLPATYPFRFFVTDGGLVCYGLHPQGRKARRPARTGRNQIRIGDQSQNGEGARPHRAAFAARPRQ